MKKIILVCFGTALSLSVSSQIYVAKTCDISFFSHFTVEDISAHNTVAKPMLNTSTGAVQMRITMTKFDFKSPLMQEHFNENYVESEKFPYALYSGKINEPVDYTKDGDTKVTVTGKFTIHGVEQERTIDGLISIKNGEITISSTFNIHVADYNIKVPSLYVTTIGEDMETKINAVLIPFKK